MTQRLCFLDIDSCLMLTLRPWVVVPHLTACYDWQTWMQQSLPHNWHFQALSRQRRWRISCLHSHLVCLGVSQRRIWMPNLLPNPVGRKQLSLTGSHGNCIQMIVLLYAAALTIRLEKKDKSYVCTSYSLFLP